MIFEENRSCSNLVFVGSVMLSFDLSGKKAVVTGASRGIGRGCALVLAQCGCDVVVNFEKSADKAEEVAEQIRGLGRDAVAVQADVSDEEQVQKLFDFRLKRELFRRLVGAHTSSPVVNAGGNGSVRPDVPNGPRRAPCPGSETCFRWLCRTVLYRNVQRLMRPTVS